LGSDIAAGLTAQHRKQKTPRAKRPAAKIDPKYLKPARELRARWLEHVNSGALILPTPGKYEVARALGKSGLAVPPEPKLLPCAQAD